MISCTTESDSVRNISRVCLADIETAAKLKEGEGIFFPIGNVLWRSPEAQTGTCVGKASDIWSFGATVCTRPLLCPLGPAVDPRSILLT